MDNHAIGDGAIEMGIGGGDVLVERLERVKICRGYFGREGRGEERERLPAEDTRKRADILTPPTTEILI